MSPRIKRTRKIFGPPAIKGLKPSCRGGGITKNKPVFLFLEEYESIKLCDYDLLNHNEASKAMGVSRPTFSRIYSAARQKVALAFVEVREIVVEGGKVYYDSAWFICNSCGCDFNHHNLEMNPDNCPLCGSNDISNLTSKEISEVGKCVCTKCGEEFELEQGLNCNKLKCPICGHDICRRY
jgi:predicted DNA-binding protein (UPF0251 family)